MDKNFWQIVWEQACFDKTIFLRGTKNMKSHPSRYVPPINKFNVFTSVQKVTKHTSLWRVGFDCYISYFETAAKL